MMMKDKNKDKINLELAATPIDGEPITSFDLVNKYGTYEIQPTCDMQTEWPTIAQGLPEDYDKPTVKPKNKTIRRNDGR